MPRPGQLANYGKASVGAGPYARVCRGRRALAQVGRCPFQCGAPYEPHRSSPGHVSAGGSSARKCTPEPCAQVRILLGAPKSNAKANRSLLVICHLTWANVRQGPPLPRRPRPRHAPGPATPDASRTSALWRATTIKTVYSPGRSTVQAARTRRPSRCANRAR
jgi:hypothetical protein